MAIFCSLKLVGVSAAPAVSAHHHRFAATAGFRTADTSPALRMPPYRQLLSTLVGRAVADSHDVMARLDARTNHHILALAHRAHIALAELGVPFEEVIIDLDRPRDPWYLEINPRGLVPTIKYGNEIIPESGIVAQFLADVYPDKAPLVPPSNTVEGALKRARIAFFVDAYFSKVQSHLFKVAAAKTPEDEAAIATAAAAGAAKELEPLLAGVTSKEKPFFGGSSRLTLAEVLTGSFAIRLVTLAKAGVYPASLLTELKSKAPATFAWIEAVAAHPSVTGIYDEKVIIASTKARLAKQRAGQL